MISRVFNPLPESGLSAALEKTQEFLCRFLVFSSGSQPIVIALWIAHTHAFKAFEFTPYLRITSPEKRCGKSRLLDCLGLLVREPWLVAQPSEAVLYRKISSHTPTVLFDEADTIFSGGRNDDKREPLRALLNAGFCRGAKVPRCVGPNHILQEFDVFCPKAIAGIGALPPTVADRSIPIELVRRSRDQSLERFYKRDIKAQTDAVKKLFEDWAADSETIADLAAARPGLPDALGDRQADICEPLLAIADMAGGDWPERARRALVELCAGQTEEESIGVQLLCAIRTVLKERREDRIATVDLLRALVDRDDGPWANMWGADVERGNLKSPAAKLARHLKAFRITPGTIRLADNSTPKGYKAPDFTDAWSRYCPPPEIGAKVATTPQASVGGPS